MEPILVVGLVVAVGLFVLGRNSRNGQVTRLERESQARKEAHETAAKRADSTLVLLQQTRGELTETKKRAEFLSRALLKLKEDPATLPSVVQWATRLQEAIDEKRVDWLRSPPHAAPRAASEVEYSLSQARAASESARLLENRVTLYEALAPWLRETATNTIAQVGEILEGQSAAARQEAAHQGKVDAQLLIDRIQNASQLSDQATAREQRARDLEQRAEEMEADARKREAGSVRRQTELEERAKQLDEVATRKDEELRAESSRNRAELDVLFDRFLTDTAALPSIVDWAIRIRKEVDEIEVERLADPPHPAPKAAKQVHEAKAKAREALRRAETLQNKVSLYEALAPWLAEYCEYTVEEILEGLEEESELRQAQESGEDPVRLFLAADDWAKLSGPERDQVALDRYWDPSRLRTAWTAGIQYERFVGYKYEDAGFSVTYHGAAEGKADLGIDLICEKEGQTHVVQCKRLSVAKGLPVRENVVAQTYGAAMFYGLKRGLDRSSVVPVIATTFELSEEAREFARLLGVTLREHLAFEPYPCIKCNVSRRSGERIYHLPFDQQYDTTVVGDQEGEFYAMTVADAVEAGFRRAFRWKGGTS